MGWRKIKFQDVERGVIVRIGKLMEDGSYCMATIVKVDPQDAPRRAAWLARPMAYAQAEFDMKSGMLFCETFCVFIDSLVSPFTDVEVFEGQTGVRMALVMAADKLI
jgi:hypothetical protein